MRKRIFIGIPVSEKLSARIEFWVNSAFKDFRIRAIAKKNLHLTLVPPWYEEKPENIFRLIQKQNRITKVFDLDFTKVEFGPNPRNPRLVWAVGETQPELLVLKKDLEKILAKAPEKRKFLTHLTIARFKPFDFKSFPVKKFSKEVSWHFKVDSFCIYESRLSSKGADYRVLKKLFLKP